MTEATENSTPATAARRKKRGDKAPAAAPKTAPAKSTKADVVIALLSRAKGASLDDMMTATGWQAHSVRGFLSGTLKKKLRRAVTSEKTGKGRIYRIAAGQAK